MSDELRERIYRHYLSDRGALPRSTADLAPRAATLRQLVHRHFPPERDAPVLDLGCGHGALLHFAREAGYTRLAGVDASPQQVETARALGIAGVEQGGAMDRLAATADAGLAAVVSFDLIEHLGKAELPFFTDEVMRVLQPGGRWIIHVPNAESPFFGRVRHGDLSHELAFTAGSLRQWLLASGFARVDCFEDRPAVHGVKSGVRRVLWAGIRLGLRLYLAVETGDRARDALFTQNLLAVAHKPGG